MERIYLDFNATTPITQKALDTMLPYFSEEFGNPASIHSYGQAAKAAITTAKAQVCQLINCNPSDLIFTSGGTEANNLALSGVAQANKQKGNHIIVSGIEHDSVGLVCQKLAIQGFILTVVSPDKNGLINPSDIKKAIQTDTILISTMYANNETGTVQPIQEISNIAQQANILFHCDAIQAVGKIPVDLETTPIDLMSISAHKMYGPKGIGALFIRKGTKISPLFYGGGHQMGLRSGTQPVPLIAGFGQAAQIAHERLIAGQHENLKQLTLYFEELILSNIKNVELNGSNTNRLPNTLHLSFDKINAHSLLIQLDMQGISASLGSACHSGSIESSHVLIQMGLSQDRIDSSIRFSLGYSTTKEQLTKTVDVLKELVEKLS